MTVFEPNDLVEFEGVTFDANKRPALIDAKMIKMIRGRVIDSNGSTVTIRLLDNGQVIPVLAPFVKKVRPL